MPLTPEQFQGLQSSTPEQRDALFASLAPDKRQALMSDVQDYMAKNPAGKPPASPQAQQSQGQWNDVGSAHPSPQAVEQASQIASRSPGGMNAYKPDTSAEDSQAAKNRTYASDVWNSPRQAVWNAVDYIGNKVGWLSDDRYAQMKAQGQQFSQQRAQDQAAASHPTLTGIVANPLNFAFPGAGSWAPVATKAGKSIAGAVIGGAYGTLDPEATPISAAIGTITGAAFPWLTGKAYELLSGTRVGDLLGIHTQIDPKYPGANALKSEMDQTGIQTSAGDITGSPMIRANEEHLARNNEQMMDFRLKQNQQASSYADKVVSDLQTAVKEQGWKGLDDVQAAATNPGKRQKEAQVLLTTIQNAGDDWGQIAQSSGNLELFTRKLKADQLFDKATAIAKLYGDVTPTSFEGSLKANISSIQGNQAQDQSLVPYLKGILEDVQNGKNLGFDELRNTRSILNSKIKSLTSPAAGVQDASAARTALGNVVNAVEDDLDRFARNHSSGLRNAWEQANDFYKTQVVPYKDAQIGKILTDQDPQKLRQLWATKDPDAQARMFDLMEPKGKAAIRSGLISDAVDAGEKTARGVQGPTFSAAQVASKLEALTSKGTMDVAFQGGGQDVWAAKGLAKVLRTVDRSDTVAFIPKTGQVLDMAGHPPTTAFEAGMRGINWFTKDNLVKLYTDPKLKALLVKASDLTPGSAAMKDLVTDQIPRALATRAQVSPNVTLFRPQLPAAASTDNPQQVAQQP